MSTTLEQLDKRIDEVVHTLENGFSTINTKMEHIWKLTQEHDDILVRGKNGQKPLQVQVCENSDYRCRQINSFTSLGMKLLIGFMMILLTFISYRVGLNPRKSGTDTKMVIAQTVSETVKEVIKELDRNE